MTLSDEAKRRIAREAEEAVYRERVIRSIRARRESAKPSAGRQLEIAVYTMAVLAIGFMVLLAAVT